MHNQNLLQNTWYPIKYNIYIKNDTQKHYVSLVVLFNLHFAVVNKRT